MEPAVLVLLRRQIQALQGIVETLVILVDTMAVETEAERAMPAGTGPTVEAAAERPYPPVFGKKQNPGEASGAVEVPPLGTNGVIGG